MLLPRHILNPLVFCFVKFTLSLVDEVTTGTCNLASVILNFADSPALDKMQSSIRFNSRWFLQFLNGIFNDLQKLHRYFNGTTIFVLYTGLFVLLTVSAVFTSKVALYLNDWEFSAVKSTLARTSSLLSCHKRPDWFE